MAYRVRLAQMDNLEKLENQVSLGRKVLLVREVMMAKMASLVHQDRLDECCPLLVAMQMVSLVKRANTARPARSDTKASQVNQEKMVPTDLRADLANLANQVSMGPEVLLEMLLASLSPAIARVPLFQSVQPAQ